MIAGLHFCQEGSLVFFQDMNDIIVSNLDPSFFSMAKMLIENMTKPFVAEDYHDEYQEITRYEKYIEGRQILIFYLSAFDVLY